MTTVKSLPPTQVSVTQSVPVGPASAAKRVAATLPAGRLPEAQAPAARRRCRRQAQQQGQTLTAVSLYLAGWGSVVTPLDPTVWTAEPRLALYRGRWPGE